MTLSADAVLAGAGVVPVEGLLRLRPSICRGATDPDQCQRCTTLMLARASPLEMLNHLATAEGTFEHLRASTVDETPLGLRPHEVTRQVAMTHLRTHCPSALARAAVSVRQSLAARSNLTVREREVLDLLLLGRSVADMATALQISPRTVKFHQQNVLAKVGADSRLDLIRLLM
jgi:DNA-binding CsgD family transcriptional regulator